MGAMCAGKRMEGAVQENCGCIKTASLNVFYCNATRANALLMIVKWLELLVEGLSNTRCYELTTALSHTLSSPSTEWLELL